MKAALKPYAARAVSSPLYRNLRRGLRARRARRQGVERQVDVYLNPRDPHGYLLLQVLPSVAERFGLTYRLFTVATLQEDLFPEPDLWQSWAIADARELARLYRLDFPETDPGLTEEAVHAAAVRLTQAEQSPNALDEALAALRGLWHGDPPLPAPSEAESEATQTTLAHNEQNLHDAGHYGGAMLHYEGEWFWGLDRLDHLERRLISKGYARHPNETARFVRTWADLGRKPRPADPVTTPLEVFFSIRSPYSYLGLERAKQLADYFGCPLHLRPVLPMVMRGQAVPEAKQWYIFKDTKREADKLGIPYGFVADPLGAGVERCYALLPYARQQGLGVTWLQTFARAVNAQGIRSETDRGLKRIVEAAGMDWHRARHWLTHQDWQDEVEANRQALYETGHWGVPTFRFGDVTAWGQDRLWRIQEAIRS
ncbi:DsbA family protein [Halomonadaceae bacterium KBTZ08]